MGLFKAKEKERYYLFAGMGGSAARRKRNLFLMWALIAAAVVAAGLAVVFVLADHVKAG